MKDIIIIGAGLSGIYAAALLQKNYNVTILEARDRIGGRVLTIDGFDMGPSWIWQHQKNILQLIQENDLELFAQYTQGDALYDTLTKVERFDPPPSAPSGRIKGGIIMLLEALEKKLILDTIKLNSPVISIENHTETVLVSTAKKSYKADLVINTLPPRLAISSLDYTPQLPDKVVDMLMRIPTWMGNSAKCTIEFETAFWRGQGLSGFCFSHVGPLGEIHDACTDEKAALFGFFHAQVKDKSEEAVKEQMERLFGDYAKQIKHIYITDWTQESYSSVKEDHKAMASHPNYGHKSSAYDDRLLFTGTEAALQDGGYLEGCVVSVKKLLEGLKL